MTVDRKFERQGPLWVPRYEYDTPGKRYERYRHRQEFERTRAVIARTQTAKIGSAASGASAITVTGTGIGNLIAVCIASFGNHGQGIGTCTDNKSGGTSTYLTAADYVLTQNVRMSVLYVENCAAGITSVSPSSTAAWAAVVLEYSGIMLSGSFDKAGAVNGQASTAVPISNNITTTYPGLILSFSASPTSNSRSYAASGAWSGVIQFPNVTDGDDAYCEEQLNVAIGTYAGAFTCTAATQTCTGIVSFRQLPPPGWRSATAGPSMAI